MNLHRHCVVCKAQIRRPKEGRRTCSPKCATRLWKREHPDSLTRAIRRWNLKTKFNLTPEQYDFLLTRQKGRCAICQCLPIPLRRLAVDHCHVSKQIRGLLCGACNPGLGYFKDDKDILGLAIEYLSRGVEEIPALPRVYSKKAGPTPEDYRIFFAAQLPSIKKSARIQAVMAHFGIGRSAAYAACS